VKEETTLRALRSRGGPSWFMYTGLVLDIAREFGESYCARLHCPERGRRV
jgi:hypothetical protein